MTIPKVSDLDPKRALTWHERYFIRLALQDNKLTQQCIARFFNVRLSTVWKCNRTLHVERAKAKQEATP